MGSVTKRYDVVAGRKYSKRDGTEATHWINVGEGAEWDDGGITLRLHSVPVGNWFDGSLKLFERKPKEERGQQSRSVPARQERQERPPSDEPLDDDIPF